MDFESSEYEKMFRQAIRNFAEKEIAPLIEEYEKNESFPLEIFSMMGNLGYLCPRYPAEYGGAGMGKIGDCICLEEVAFFSVGITSSLIAQGGLSTSTLYLQGSEQQKEYYLVPSIKGQKIAAFGLTEPNAGSDITAIETTATRKNGNYVLNGTKTFITNGTICDFVVIAAYTDKNKGPRNGISLLIIDKGTRGFNTSKLHKFCGRSSDTAELSFDDCVITEDKLIGEEGQGLFYIMDVLCGGRISHAARSLGLARAAYDASLKYAKEREQFGRPISKFQINAFKLARMAMEIEAAHWLTYHAAWLFDHGKPCVREASIAKLFASEVVVHVTTEAMQIHGGYSLVEDSVVQRYFRDARLATITEGTSEIQQIIISREIGA